MGKVSEKERVSLCSRGRKEEDSDGKRRRKVSKIYKLRKAEGRRSSLPEQGETTLYRELPESDDPE